MANKIKTINRTGLVGEWLLNGNALDTSGSGNNGTATNVTYTGTDRGYQSQCGVFNGISSYISATAFSGTGVRSVSFMVNLTSLNNDKIVFIHGAASTNNSWGIVCKTTTGNLAAFIYGGNEVVSTINSGIHHCVITFNGTSMSFYIDNILIGSTNISLNITDTGIRIGSNRPNNGQFFSGNVSGFRYYNYVLSSQEIQTLYQEGLRQLGGQSYGSLFDGLVAYYDMNGDAQDIVGGNNGTVSGATLTTDRFGVSNRAYQSTSGYINLGVPSNFGDFTFSGFVYPTSNRSSDNNSDNIFWDIRNSSTGNQLCLLKYTDGIFTFQMYNGTVFSIISTQAINNLYHISCIRNGSNMSLYINGQLVNTITSFPTQLSPNVNYLFALDNNTFRAQGRMECYMQFNRALSSDEIKLLYQISSTTYPYPF